MSELPPPPPVSPRVARHTSRSEPLPPELDPRGRRAAHARIRQQAAPQPSRLGRDARFGLLLGTKIIAALLSLTVVIGSYWVWNTWTDFKASIPHGAAVAPVAAGKKDIDGADQNILLMGNDSRAGATPAELRALGTANDGGSSNTDTMMIMHVPGNGSSASVISFPRDSYVSIPGYGMNKLNAAYPEGYSAARSKGTTEIAAQSAGIALLNQTLAQLTGLHIDHYVQINLLGFYRISDAIQGVPVVLCQAQKEAKSAINLPAGLSMIQGSQALAFVRQRYNVPGSDLGRIQRQQYFLKSVFHKLTGSGTLLNPLKVGSLLGAVSSSLLTDPAIDLLSLAASFAQLSEGNLVFKTIPNDGDNTNSPAGDVIVINPTEVQRFVDSVIGIAADPALAAASTMAPSAVTVNVLNGSSQNGVATRNATQLRTTGFTVGTIGDNPSTTSTTEIEYANGMQSQAKTLAAQVPGAQLVETSSVTAVTLLLGTDGLEVKGLALTPTSTTGSTTAPASTLPVGTGVPNVPNQAGCIA